MAEILFYACIPLGFAAFFVVVVWMMQYVQRGNWSDGSRRIVLYRGPLAIALVLLCTGLGISVHYADVARRAAFDEAHTNFLHQAEEIETDLQGQIGDLSHLLDGVRGLFLSSNHVTLAEFRRFVESSALRKEFPGARGLGYVERVERSGLAQFVQRQRKQGRPDFAVQTEGTRSTLFVVEYLEPEEHNAGAIGYDIGSETVRRAAAEGAMRLGQRTLTPRVRLVQDELQRPAFLFMVPIYAGGATPASEEQRVRSLRGWLDAPVVFSELIGGGTASAEQLVNYQLFDGPELNAASLVYDSELPSGRVDAAASLTRHQQSAFSVVRPILVVDKVFYLRANSSPAFEARHGQRDHLNAVLLGSGLSVLASMVLWLVLAGRARAIELAQSMTQDLDRLAMVARRTFNAVYFADTAWCITWVNEGFTRMTGFAPKEALGLRPSELLHSPLEDPDMPQQIDRLVDAGSRLKIQVLQRSKQGQDYWVDLEIMPVHGARGNLTGYLSVQSDITEQVQAKAALLVEKERAENVLSGTNVGTWESNLLTGEQQWNDRWAAMLGFSREEVQPSADQFWQQRLNLADRQRLNQAMAQCIAGVTDSYSCDVRVRRKDGNWMWILSRAKVMSRTKDGQAEWIGGIHTDITEIKQVELSLREMEAFLDRAGRIAGVGAWQIDFRTRVVVFSAQTCAIHGMAPGFQPSEEVALSFYPEADRQRLHQAMQRAQADGTPWDMVVEFNNAQGQALWVRIFGEVGFDESGPARVVGAFQDVTRDRLAQLEVERINAQRECEQRRLQNILEGTHVGTWEWNVQTGESLYNDQYMEMLGYTLEELAPLGYESWARLVHPEDLVASDAKVQQHLRGERAGYEIEVRMQHKLGHWIWVLAKGKLASRSADGRPLWVYGTHMDITERKLAERQLAQTTATLQNVLDSATAVGVITLGLDHVISVFNRGAENLLGYSAGELIGRQSGSLLFEAAELAALGETLELAWGHVPHALEVFAHVLQIREPQEWTLVCKNGSRFHASLIFSPMYDLHGVLVGKLAVIYDISKQKEYESSLREAMRMAEQSSVAKSQFLANMSHEIRTPMNAILGMLQLLRNTTLNTNQRDYAEKAAGAARSLLGLLNDILDFSKVEAGKMQLNPEPFVLESVLGDLSVILSSNLGGKNVDLLFDVDPALPRALIGDAMRLKQILINLGGNAVKFTEKGEVLIRWTLLARTPERVKMGVAVVDTGIGIAPENQSRIFSAFTQAEANTTRRFGGTGLGLVISTRLIRLMGGELELTSAVGQGSTFRFTLELGVAQNAPALGAPDSADLQPVRAMLVDDNPQALASSAAMMRSLGWQVSEAASGAQALDLLKAALETQAESPDALFVDWQMPGMDGWETLRNVRRLYGQGRVPLLILLSRQSRDGMAQRTGREQELLNGLMVKPLTAAMFAQTLATARDSSASLQTQPLDRTQRLAGMRVLLVEDNAINQQVAQELLASEGAHVTLAENGRIGVDAVVRADPAFDAVLMDLQMPVMDGISATRVLRADARFLHLPVIAMTANAMRSDRDECLAAGMNDHVGKPFDLNLLVQVLIQHTHWVVQVAGHAPAPVPTTVPVPTSAPGTDLATLAAPIWPEEIAVEEALARMGGNRGLLQRSLQGFIGDARVLPQRLDGALQAGDLVRLKAELHTFKGLAATVGVPALAELAAQAEKLLQVPKHLADYPAAVERVLTRLTQLLPVLQGVADALTPAPVVSERPRARTLDPAAIVQLKELLQALQSSDMAAVELHALLRQGLDDALAATLVPLDSAMAELDFEAAAAACDQLVRLSVPHAPHETNP